MKKILCFACAATLAVTVLTACGNQASEGGGVKDSALSTEENVATMVPNSTPYVPAEVPSKFKASGSNIKQGDDGYVVDLEERQGEERYDFESEDLGFVDTKTGAIISIGMTADDIEDIIGSPRTVDREKYRKYDGIIIKYDDDQKASQIIVAAGNMDGDDDPHRYVSPRGVKLNTTLDSFKTVYGDEYTSPKEAAEGDDSIKSTASMAVRYYAKNGNDFEYLGGSYNNNNKPENDEDLIMQTFMFSLETDNISVMSIQAGTEL